MDGMSGSGGGAASGSWASGAGADAHDVYLGTDLAAVEAADTSSVEFMGIQAQTGFAPGEMAPGRTYYWRVDERYGATVVSGSTWRFSLDETLGNSLRVGKTASGDPVLSWRELGNATVYEIQRCELQGPEGCTPVTADVTAAYTSIYTDAAAPAARMLWYKIGDVNPCAP